MRIFERAVAPWAALAVVVIGIGGATATVVVRGLRQEAGRVTRPASTVVRLDRAEPATSATGLSMTIAAMDTRLSANPADSTAAVQLAQALLRQSRVNGDGGLILRADQALQQVLEHDPTNYDVEQTRGLLLLSAHKFQQAVEVGARCNRVRPLDPVNLGIIGDGQLELGNYDAAFDAFDQMMQLRPGAASYARVAYAREIQGNLEGALAAMRLAAAAVPGTDLESLAWHRSQIGELLLKLGRADEARDAFISASGAYPGHPFAVLGYARTLRAGGDLAGATAALASLKEHTANPDVHILSGQILEAQGDVAAAAREFAIAEVGLRGDWAEPRHLAVFLADRGRAMEAVQIAEQTSRSRDDIFTNDALAWAYFNAGRVDEARRVSARAARTGSRDPDILAHARTIHSKRSTS